MSASVNNVVIAGNMTRDPESRTLEGGNTVCNFGVAINRKYKAKDGTQKEEVAFIECTAWNSSASFISQYLHKGDSILVEGRLTQESFTDKEGKKQSKTRVCAERVSSLSGRREQQEAPAPIRAVAVAASVDDDLSPPF